MGTDLSNLGSWYLFTQKYEESEKAYRRALAIRIKAFGESDPAVTETMGSYASALRGLHRVEEATAIENRIHAAAANQTSTAPK